MKTPDITPAQVGAALGSILSVLVSFGVDLTAEQRDSLLDLTGILAAFLLGSDALIRFGRSRALKAPQ